jgi:CO/xanthine dehydrogenase FAD-binding subunit
MRAASFDYHRAESLDHATGLLAELGEDARPIAGGYSIVPMMNLRLARPGHLVDINRLGLDRIARDNGLVRLGGLVRHCQYGSDPVVGELLPLFADAARHIAHPTIRARGTLGGSLAHADPTAELALMAVLHDGVVVARCHGGERRIRATDFFLGAFTTALEPGEIVVELEVPVPPAGTAGAFVEFAERAGDFAIVSVGVRIRCENGRIQEAQLACAGASPVPVRGTEAEQFLIGRPLEAPEAREAGRNFAATLAPPDDIRATADYRRHLVAELTRRALQSACRDAGEMM